MIVVVNGKEMDTPTDIYEALKDDFCHDDTFNNIIACSDWDCSIFATPFISRRGEVFNKL